MECDIPKHRIQGSYRILIGPWDDKTPLPLRAHQTIPAIPPSSQRSEPAKDATGDVRPGLTTLQGPMESDSYETAHRNTGTLSLEWVNSNNVSHETFFTADSAVPPKQYSNDAESTITDQDLEDDPFRSRLETGSSSDSTTNAIQPSHSSPTILAATNDSNHSIKSGRSGSIVDYNVSTEASANSQNTDIHGTHNKSSNDGGVIIPQITYNDDLPKTKKRSMKIPKKQSLRTNRRSLLWRESGPVFVPRLPEHLTSPFSNIDHSGDRHTVIKHDVLLCMRMTNATNGVLPKTYNQRATKSLKRQDGWRQLETVLTPATLECYDSTMLLWPYRKLVHRISLDGEMDSSLSLYMLSSLDYTFCLAHTPKGSKSPVTVVFRARSLTLCHEWYVALYRMLPRRSKKPFPSECEVYIPSINLRVHLPLVRKQHPHHHSNQEQEQDWDDSRYSITMDQVKNAVLDLLARDADWMSLFGHRLKRSDLSLCWTRKDRAEWIYWKESVDNTQRSDKVICPQTIENTHQLELRPIQHTPQNVVLDEKTTLLEPLACEGFLTKVTDFEGRVIKTGSWLPRRFYFSSFGGFLFAIPSHKAKLPDPSTYMDPANINIDTSSVLSSTYLDRMENSPYVTLATPFAGNKNDLSQKWQQRELRRRMYLVAASSGHINLAEVSYVQRSFGGYSSSDALLVSSTMQPDQDSRLQKHGHKSYASQSTSSMATSTSPILENGPPAASTLSMPSPSSPPSQHRRLSNFGQGLSHRKNLRNRERPCIDLVMNNGITLKLRAYSSDTCDQWVKCLTDLVIYAKARMEADRDVHSETGLAAEFNMKLKLSNKQRDHQASSGFGSVTCLCGRPDTSHNFVDTRIWSLCVFSQCRDIVKSGVMYMRSKGIFSQKQFILTMDGRLHYYNIYKRSRDDGKPIRTGIHERKGMLDMANAYVYSGLTSSLDGNLPGSRPNRPPRLFDNGMTATDPDEHCFFTIWIPKRRRIFSPQRQRIMVYDTDQHFNSTGKRWLFLTPSRQEREEWVWAITIIQEALLREAVRKQNQRRPSSSSSNPTVSSTSIPSI